ncbi:ferritin [Paludibacter sp. 221]|uniref:ferritin-like domain-containing protein n=1 Tax=Paludibacter sp. 221 TaxID=2302939 RepID=UPI0013D2E07C|nr:ferritin-like domain-containing protein [Paludibacter sp. 221]NDV47041.1 ferritin [Paludibacter sp. 221]
MGKESVDIIKKSLDVKKLLEMLNAALSEEWLAYYQYWVGAALVEGPMRPSVQKELEIHAKEELGHADMLVERIIQLEGTPVLSPEEWTKLARCKYYAPTNPYIVSILNDNLKGERCAIVRYQEIADYTFGKDHETYKIATQILADELEHEQEIEDWLKDISDIKK